MAATQDGSVALLSIHPRFVEEILSGRKRVEFRRSRFKNEPSYVVIYATEPVAKIVGFFEVEKIRVARPNTIWKQYRDVGGISKKDFSAYYEGAAEAVAIEIREVHQLPSHLPLARLLPGTKPPQSFRYLGHESVQRLRALS